MINQYDIQNNNHISFPFLLISLKQVSQIIEHNYSQEQKLSQCLIFHLKNQLIILMRLTMAETDRSELRSGQKIRQSRKDCDNQLIRMSMMKKNTKSKMESDERQGKITKFLNCSNSISKPRVTLSDISSQNVEKQNKIAEFEVKLSEKEEEIKKIKLCNEALKKRVNDSSEEIRKRQIIIAKSMLDIANVRRKQRKEIDKSLGYFTDLFRKFTEGTSLTFLREKIKQLEKALVKIQEDKKKANPASSDLIRLLGSAQFKTRELNELKKELENKERQVIQYRERLRLVDKEEKSEYYQNLWPIIYDKYQTLELLGSGGFGEVYKCYDLERNKIVAIKRMKFEANISAKHFEEYCRHVKREIQIQEKLNHPNIAKLEKVLQIDEQKRCIIFELEHCLGPELSTYLKRNKSLDQREAKIIIKQILCALDYLYNLKEKVIHYDLKPSNIIFHEGVIKVLDFGLCKTIDSNSDQTKIQLTSQGVGTYWYLPPQTFQPFDPHISSKVDVWSVGVIFYQMLYGKRPFGHGMSQDQIYNKGVILKATKVDFPQENSKKSKISEGAKEFICACLKYNPDERLNPTEAYEHPYLNIKK